MFTVTEQSGKTLNLESFQSYALPVTLSAPCLVKLWYSKENS